MQEIAAKEASGEMEKQKTVPVFRVGLPLTLPTPNPASALSSHH